MSDPWDDVEIVELPVFADPDPEVERAQMRERRACVARHPGPEVERYWPVSTRAMAIEFARQARLRGRPGSFAVDDATLERVADAIMDPANPPPWVALTAEERRDELPKGLWDALQEYLGDHPGVGGYVELGRRDGRSTFFVGIAGDPRPHQIALATIGGDRVVVEPWAEAPPCPDAELWAIKERLSADAAELATAGWHVVDVLDSARVGLEIAVVGVPGERAAAEFFSARYDTAVEVRWLGPHRLRERLRPFGSWEAEGRRLRVYFALDPNGERRGTIRLAEENEERIVVALSSLDPVALTETLIGGFIACHAEVELRQPVGSRVVIDASTGVARPSVTLLRPGE